MEWLLFVGIVLMLFAAFLVWCCLRINYIPNQKDILLDKIEKDELNDLEKATLDEILKNILNTYNDNEIIIESDNNIEQYEEGE